MGPEVLTQPPMRMVINNTLLSSSSAAYYFIRPCEDKISAMVFSFKSYSSIIDMSAIYLVSMLSWSTYPQSLSFKLANEDVSST